jgi:hypothetical protein
MYIHKAVDLALIQLTFANLLSFINALYWFVEHLYSEVVHIYKILLIQTESLTFPYSQRITIQKRNS